MRHFSNKKTINTTTNAKYTVSLDYILQFGRFRCRLLSHCIWTTLELAQHHPRGSFDLAKIRFKPQIRRATVVVFSHSGITSLLCSVFKTTRAHKGDIHFMQKKKKKSREAAITHAVIYSELKIHSLSRKTRTSSMCVRALTDTHTHTPKSFYRYLSYSC